MPAAMTEIVSMKLTSCVALLAVVGGSLGLSAGHAETPEEWIKLGARVHGGFGAFIPAGIRIGLDALERLKAEPRDVRPTTSRPRWETCWRSKPAASSRSRRRVRRIAAGSLIATASDRRSRRPPCRARCGFGP
jgi:hypothetical protein